MRQRDKDIERQRKRDGEKEIISTWKRYASPKAVDRQKIKSRFGCSEATFSITFLLEISGNFHTTVCPTGLH